MVPEGESRPRQVEERGFMHWNDRVYGEVAIGDRAVLEVVNTPTFQRLRGVRQAGPSAIAFPFKNVTRFEHSLGVYQLLGRLGAGFQERVAGLLHDISHTAFSHAVDFLVTSEEQDHHESLKPVMLDRPDLARAIEKLGFRPRDFYDDTRYPLLERPLPLLCADRLDYFLRDGLACKVLTPSDTDQILSHLAVIDATIVITDLAVARRAAALFDQMNRDWWASPTEAFIYNEFADVLREGFRRAIIDEADLMTEDEQVLAKLDASASTLIATKLAQIRRFDPSRVEGYRPRVVPKARWLDPPVQVGEGFRRMSELGG
jgi:HD superfamily phosphohydrolase